MPGGARGAQPEGRWAPRGRCQHRSAVPSLLPALQPPRSIEWSLRCPWTWWAGCGPRGTCRGNKSQAAAQQPQQKGIAAPSPAPPLAFCALLPSAPLPLRSPHRRQPSWALWAELAVRRAAVRSLRWRESSPLLPGVKTLPLPPFLPSSLPPEPAGASGAQSGWDLGFYFSVGLASMKGLNSPKWKV